MAPLLACQLLPVGFEGQHPTAGLLPACSRIAGQFSRFLTMLPCIRSRK